MKVGRANAAMMSLLATVALFVGGCASPGGGKDKPNPYFATVQQIEGAPQWAHGDNVWKPLPLHAKVYQGDRVRTDAKSVVNLLFGKYGGTLKVPEATEIGVEEFGPSFENMADTKVVVHIATGHVVGNTLNLPETTKFFIKTQLGTMQIK